MSLGPIRLSSEVGKGAAAPSSAGRISIRTPHLEAGRPFDGAAAAGRAYQQLGAALDRRRERKVEEVSAETAQRVQAAMSDASLKLYDRKEKDAAGVVAAWDKECQKAIKEAGANLDPDTRKAFERRMAPWMAGRRENLMEHQFREVRRGRVNALENDMRSTAAAETNDILALTASEQEDWNARLASGTKPEDIAAERDKAFDTHFKQMMAVQQATETRYADAAQQGLYGAEEAKSRCLKSRHDAAKTLLGAAVKSGNADFAEYALNRLEEGKGENTAAARCGLTADELTGYRSAVQRVRDSKAADAKREAAELAQKANDDAIRREAQFFLQMVPKDEAGQEAMLEKGRVFFEEQAADPKISPELKLRYAKNARSLARDVADAKRKNGEKENIAKTRLSTKEQDMVHDILKRNIQSGRRPTTAGNSNSFTTYSPEDMKKDVDEALSQEKITPLQWLELATMADKEYTTAEDRDNDEACEQFMNSILSRYSGLFPSAIKYHADRNLFAFEPSAGTMSRRITPDTQITGGPSIVWGPDDKDQLATYGQFVQVLNSVKEMRRRSGRKMTLAEMEKQFDEEFGPTARGRAARSAAEKIGMLETASEAW